MSTIIGIHGGHDAAVAIVTDGRLHHVREAEKGSHRRHDGLNDDLLLSTLCSLPDWPDAISRSGWWKGVPGRATFPTGVGYHGLERIRAKPMRLLGREAALYETTHERSHIWCGLGLSGICGNTVVQVILWEGDIGSLYRVDESNDITRVARVMSEPGSRYIFPYAIADPAFADARDPALAIEHAGKQMALTAFAPRFLEAADDEAKTLRRLLDAPSVYGLRKADFADDRLYNVGVESPRFTRFAKLLSDAIFGRFEEAVSIHFSRDFPLVLVGGCALNCEWNTRLLRRWNAPVFIPPCPNDSGIAIGAAIDAHVQITGVRQIEWRVDCGDNFVHDAEPGPAWTSAPADLTTVARLLADGKVLAWVSDRFELGPRALGNRSILAAPFRSTARDQLNRIKQRERFRPVAPVCQLERVSDHFDWQGESPHMLFFQQVLDSRLEAVTHVDGTARVQTVTRLQNARLWDLLSAFDALAGVPILCNTSLNFSGTGAINAMSELVRFADERVLDGFVVGDTMWFRA